MKQKIGLFREKRDDILAAYIKEFFKLTGFIIRDVIIPEEEIKKGKYDFILQITSDFPREEDNDITTKDSGTDSSFTLLKLKRPEKITLDGNSSIWHSFLCDQILKKLFPENILEELENISAIYTERNLFYFLYNKGNLKYVEEYYPITGAYNNTISDSRHKAFRMTLEVYQKSHDQLESYIQSIKTPSYHSMYMLLKLRYKINDISDLLGRGHIYRTANMLNSLDSLLKSYPDFIRASYLRAHICAADSQYLREAELYYKQAIYSMHTLYSDDADESFLRYQLGRYFEKKRTDIEKAETFYMESYKYDGKWYRILFKIALFKKRHHQEFDTIDLCNQIIVTVLNGYQMKELPPKEQIYIYKCFRLLGDTFSQIRRYDLAEKSYNNAILISEAGCNFYDDLHTIENKYECFNEVLSACMPKQPIYRRLVHCAMGMSDDAEAEKYYSQMIKS